MSADRQPQTTSEDARPLFTLELWQLVLLAVGLIALAGKFLLGSSIPHPSGKAPLLVLALLLVLGLLLVLRKRRAS